MPDKPNNFDINVINDFGSEWGHFRQSELSDKERQLQFQTYFSIFPWDKINRTHVGFDAGCGTGRWAFLVAQRVKHLYCVDPSTALDVARSNLRNLKNCSFHNSTIDSLPFPDNSMDFGYSLGVLHHLPDTQRGLIDCVSKLKPGAPFLLYIYYSFDNQPPWYYFIWSISDILRQDYLNH